MERFGIEIYGGLILSPQCVTLDETTRKIFILTDQVNLKMTFQVKVTEVGHIAYQRTRLDDMNMNAFVPIAPSSFLILKELLATKCS